MASPTQRQYISILEDGFLADLPGKESKAKYDQETFNSIAKNYDLMNTLMTFGLDKSWRRRRLNVLN